MKKIILTIALMLTIVSFSKAQKFAYVDTDYIMENITEFVAAQQELDELSKQWQQEIEQKLKEVEEMYKDYRAEAVLLPEDMKQKREEAIIQKEKEVKDLQMKRFGKDGDLFQKRQELVKPIQDRVYNALSEIAEQENYAVIFDKSSGLSMLYTNPRYDLSDDVIEKLGYRPSGND